MFNTYKEAGMSAFAIVAEANAAEQCVQKWESADYMAIISVVRDIRTC